MEAPPKNKKFTNAKKTPLLGRNSGATKKEFAFEDYDDELPNVEE